MAKIKENQPTFEELLLQLEKTVSELEQGRLTLEQMLEKYAQGIELLLSCRSILNQAEQIMPIETTEGEPWR
ncbi:MAG: exodeoxyribonuclease VII small subunit [Firmicutes bacterium]|nr:exodeoxyribonuclease VII small subunit [Bacillota bacterium]